jgi:pilus assembly protein Flp/PilA
MLRTRRVQEMLKKLFKDERGQDMAEYGLLVALIAIVALVGVKLLGPAIDDLYDKVTTAIG